MHYLNIIKVCMLILPDLPNQNANCVFTLTQPTEDNHATSDVNLAAC